MSQYNCCAQHHYNNGSNATRAEQDRNMESSETIGKLKKKTDHRSKEIRMRKTRKKKKKKKKKRAKRRGNPEGIKTRRTYLKKNWEQTKNKVKHLTPSCCSSTKGKTERGKAWSKRKSVLYADSVRSQKVKKKEKT